MSILSSSTIGGRLAGANHHAPPILDGNGNIYALMSDTGTDDLEMMKSSNGGVDWTEQDQTNAPSDVVADANPTALACVQRGTVIHVAWLTERRVSGMDSLLDVYYATFNTSDAGSNPDTWQIEESVVTVTVDGSTTARNFVDIAIDASGNVTIVHPGTVFTSMGTGYWTASISYRTAGGSWTTDVGISGSVTVDTVAAAIDVVPGSGNRVVVYETASTDVIAKPITFSTSVGTGTVVDSVSVPAGGVDVFGFLDSGSTARIAVAYRIATSTYARRINTDGTIESGEFQFAVNGSEFTPNSGIYMVGYLAYDNTNDDLYSVFPVTDGDLWYNLSANGIDANWATEPTEIETTTGNNQVNAAIYDRSGLKLAYIVTLSASSGLHHYGETSLAAGAGTIDLTHLDASPTFFGPTVAASSIILAHLNNPPGFFNPVVADSSIDLTHLSNPPTFHQPTLVDIAIIALNHLDASPTFFAPQFDGNIDLNTLDAAPTFFAPSLVGVIDLNHLSNPPTFFNPHLAGNIDLALLDASPTFHNITVEGVGIITLNLLDASPTFPPITVQPGVQILDMDLLDASPTFFAPSLVGVIQLNHLDNSPTFFAVQLDGNIDLNHLDASPVFFAPQLDGSINLNHLDASPTFFAVAVVGLIDLANLDASPTFFGPTLAESSIDLDTLDASPTFHNITVASAGGAPLNMDLLDASPTFFATELVGAIDLNSFNTTQIFNPDLVGNIDLDSFTSTAFYEPVVGQASIDLEALDNAPNFFAPSFVGVIDLVSADFGPVFHAPTIGASSIDLNHLFATQIFSITVVDGGAPAPVGFQLPLRGVDR